MRAAIAVRVDPAQNAWDCRGAAALLQAQPTVFIPGRSRGAWAEAGCVCGTANTDAAGCASRSACRPDTQPAEPITPASA